MANATRRQVEAAYSEARGRAMGARTWRLRWQLRRLPRHSDDPLVTAERKAVLNELDQRGVAS